MVYYTKWRNRNGNRYVPYLLWFGDRWYLNFNWLDNDWNSNDRLVVPRKLLISTPLLEEGLVFKIYFLYPTAQHFTNFVYVFRKMYIFLTINSAYFPKYL